MGQGSTSADVYPERRVLHLVTLLVLAFLVSGCSFWQRWIADNEVESTLASPARTGVWTIEDGWSRQQVAELLRRRGLMTPVLDLLPDGELLPDYIRSAKLYDGLSHQGLHLVSGEYSWKWHYRMVAAVEQSCPEHATDPLPSCQSSRWYRWLPGLSAGFYDRYIVADLLSSSRADYLVVSDPAVYETGAVRNLRYAASSLPLVQMPLEQRRELLQPVLSQVSLVIIKVEKSAAGEAEHWHQVVARCDLATETGHGSEALMALSRDRTSLLDELHTRCTDGLQDIKGAG